VLQKNDDWTEDRLLGGRVILRQPRTGFRAAIDPVLLAAAVPAKAGERVLEIGAGTGAAALCLARRVEGVLVHGLELQRDLAGLLADNAAANGLAERVLAVPGDLLRPPPIMERDTYDHVLANPPYLDPGAADPSADEGRRIASVEGEADLADWVRFGLSMLKPKGSLTIIHRADRLDDVLGALRGEAGGIVVFPLWPRAGQAAKRVIVQARKGSGAPLTLAPGLALHGAGSGYTQEAEAALRHASALKLA
jgi:tRNA1(Val) A37 N6-methylase TrmN6